jgi:hypothetical protein
MNEFEKGFNEELEKIAKKKLLQKAVPESVRRWAWGTFTPTGRRLKKITKELERSGHKPEHAIAPGVHYKS